MAGKGQKEEEFTQVHEETQDYIHYLDCSDGFTGEHIWQNSLFAQDKQKGCLKKKNIYIYKKTKLHIQGPHEHRLNNQISSSFTQKFKFNQYMI